MHNRREAIKKVLAGSVALSAAAILPACGQQQQNEEGMTMQNNINHSVCRWTYDHMTLDELCKTVKSIGFAAIDLVGPDDWPVLKAHGVDSSMCNGAEINLVDGWNEKANHATLIRNYEEMIPRVAEAGYRNLICFSGNRRGMDDETGLQNCVEGLQQIMPLAERAGVMIQMELLNSKIDHPDYMADRTSFGVELCKRLGSDHFKLLYDIYHMQIDEGDIIRTIQDHHPYIGHYHTAGVPGRNEIDERQELYYPAIMQAIVDTDFKGYVAQEFIPVKEDKVASLRQAIRICDV
jgi:hydroxypyruvate isomerase